MSDAHELTRQVYAAKDDVAAADRLIDKYLPVIKAETAKFLGRLPGSDDDEVSIAMIAFHEAVEGYSHARGAFLRYAAMLMKSRLIDYRRGQRRHQGHASLDAPGTDGGAPAGEALADGSAPVGEERAMRDATRAEIEELSRQMADFGVHLTDVADNCPRQQRTLDACRKALAFAKSDPALMAEFLRTKRLPLAQLAQGSGAARKTLERHRSYLVALLVVYSNGYEIIRGHLKQVLKGGAEPCVTS